MTLRAPVMHYPSAMERRYYAILLGMLQEIRTSAKVVLIPAFKRAKLERDASMRSDDWGDWLDSATFQLTVVAALAIEKAKAAMRRIPGQIVATGREKFQSFAQKVVGAVAATVDGGLATSVNAWASNNARIVTDMGNSFVRKLTNTTVEAVTTNRTVTDYTNVVNHNFRAAKGIAAATATTEVGKFNSEVIEYRSRKLGFNEYVWRTRRDERVRPKHRALENKICRWDDPSVYRDYGSTVWRKRSGIGGYVGHPGRDYNCRCVPEIVVGGGQEVRRAA